MGKFASIQSDIFSVFALAAWEAEGIPTFPTSFVQEFTADEFIRVSIIASGTGINLSSLSGLLIIDIFSSAGVGPSRFFHIADKLDDYLVGKSLEGVAKKVTQFNSSTLSGVSQDTDNKSLSRASYTIPFNFYGVQ